MIEETERLILRRFVEEDAESLFLILKDKKANTFLPWFPIETLEQAQGFLRNRFLAYDRLPCSYRYAICLKKDNIPIGYVNISDDASHDLGYGLRIEFWHKGIATEACSAIVEHFRKADFPYITATHDINNPRSGAVMQKLGMTYRYSYEERVQPKNMLVTFRMYQLNFDGRKERTYMEYWDKYENHFIEPNV